MSIKKVNCKNLAGIKAYSHAVIAGDFIYLSGILGTRQDKMEIIKGGVVKETEQILFHFENILGQCGAGLADIVKVTVYLTDMENFHDMNSAYLDVIQFEPPARATVGVKELALGASVEMDCVAYKPA